MYASLAAGPATDLAGRFATAYAGLAAGPATGLTGRFSAVPCFEMLLFELKPQRYPSLAAPLP